MWGIPQLEPNRVTGGNSRPTPPSTTTPAAGAPAAPVTDGARWLLVPVSGRLPANLGASENGGVSSGAILAVKISHQTGTFSIQPAWTSENIAAPLTPIVVNGVVFAASGPTNAPATLYALNGVTGKTLAERDNDHFPAVGSELVGWIRSRVRWDARWDSPRVRLCDGTALGDQIASTAVAVTWTRLERISCRFACGYFTLSDVSTRN